MEYKIENIHLRYFVKQYENYLGVKWDNKNKDDKAKKEALKDSLVAFIPMLLWSSETLRKQKNSYFVGENNSRIWLDGHYVHKWSKPLNNKNMAFKMKGFSGFKQAGPPPKQSDYQTLEEYLSLIHI